MGWIANNTLRDDRGRTISPKVSSTRLIYVSEAGRAFMKAVFKSARRSSTRAYAPGDATVGGSARSILFEAGKLIAVSSFKEGAVQIVASFDGSYSTCSVDVTYGRNNGKNIRRRGIDGVMYEIVESNISGQRCSIMDGNTVAD